MTDTRVNVGDKIRFLGKSGFDLTNGAIYDVCETRYDDPNQKNYPFLIRDDVRDPNGFPSQAGEWELAEKAKPEPMGRTFDEDYRTSNPKLHALYVENALDTLATIQDAIENFNSHSRVDSLLIAGTLRKERAALVKRSAAYFEAAAILYVGKDWLENAS